MTKRQKVSIMILALVIIILLSFMLIDHYFILTKWSAVNYGRQLLEDKFAKPKGATWSEKLPLKAEKTDGIWKVYDTFKLPEGFIGSRYFVTFKKRNQVIDIGFE